MIIATMSPDEQIENFAKSDEIRREIGEGIKNMI